MSEMKTDPRLDLVFERVVDIPPEVVWKAWTTPKHLLNWFTPEPWQTVDCELNVTPGGIFRTVMRSPEGKEFPSAGCFLEVVPNRKLVWTSALGPGYRPARLESELPCNTFFFTAVLMLEPHERGTKYTAMVMHADEEGAKKHRELGFEEGWGKALDQLVAYMKSVG